MALTYLERSLSYIKSIVILICCLISFNGFAQKKSFKIGVLIDYSGKTRDVARPYLRGLKDYFTKFNNEQSHPFLVELVIKDTKYNPLLAVKYYKELRDKKVKVIHAWGTASCLKIMNLAKKDKIIVFTASYDEILSSPKKSPYTFFMGASYTDQAIMALKYIKKENPNAKVALIYNSTSFGKSPFFNKRFNTAIKKLKLNVVIKQVIALNSFDSIKEMKKIEAAKADYAIIQETTKATVSILSAAKKIGLKTKLIGLNWAFNENIMRLVQDASDGYMGIPLFAHGNEVQSKGIREIREHIILNKRASVIPSKFVAGWATAMVIVKGVSLSIEKNTSLLNGFESINNFSTDGISTPVSFSPKDHSGLKSIKIYVMKDMKIKTVNNEIYKVD